MLVISGVISIALAVLLMPKLISADRNDSDVLTQVLGGASGLAADAAYQEADLYFHAGVAGGCPDEHEGECHEGETAQKVSKLDLPLMNSISYLHGETAPKKHLHVEGAEEKELLPWFVAAVRLDPHHVEAWRTGAYWYYRTGDVKRACSFLTDGIKANPLDYRMYFERGILEHRTASYRAAMQDMETARKYWKSDLDEGSYDRKSIERYLEDSKAHIN
jgi:tetratricopeptide (TPR) repeat protein